MKALLLVFRHYYKFNANCPEEDLSWLLSIHVLSMIKVFTGVVYQLEEVKSQGDIELQSSEYG